MRVLRFRLCAPTPGPPRETVVDGPLAAGDPHLRYEGRWAVSPSDATTVTSGARMFLRFRGSSVTARFDTTGITEPPHVYAIVDGVKRRHLIVDREAIRLTPEGLPAGTHTVELVVKDVSDLDNRWNPPLRSALRLRQLVLPGGSVLLGPPAVPAVRFTFLGDSITQGLNILCATGGPDCADSTLDYARLVADRFGAGLEQVGFGGQGVTKGGAGGVPRAADSLALDFAGAPAGRFDAQLVVINHVTNDGYGLGDPAGVRSAYAEFLRRVRDRYRDATILALEPFGVGGETGADVVAAAVAEAGDPRTRFVSTRGWLAPPDFTDSIHPNEQGHRRATERLAEVIGREAGIRPR